jgi:hypothetical protein
MEHGSISVGKMSADYQLHHARGVPYTISRSKTGSSLNIFNKAVGFLVAPLWCLSLPILMSFVLACGSGTGGTDFGTPFDLKIQDPGSAPTPDTIKDPSSTADPQVDLGPEIKVDTPGQDGSAFDAMLDVLKDLGLEDLFDATGIFGTPCTSDADCFDGPCVPTPDGNICSIWCEESCPPDFECRGLEPSLADSPAACLHPTVNLCRPCTEDIDCLDGGGGLDDRCILYGPESGSFCASPCTDD